MAVGRRRELWGIGFGLLVAAGGCGLLGGYDFGGYRGTGGGAPDGGVSSSGTATASGSGGGAVTSSSTSGSGGSGGAGTPCMPAGAPCAGGGVCDTKGACRAQLEWVTSIVSVPTDAGPGMVSQVLVTADSHGSVTAAGAFSGEIAIGGKSTDTPFFSSFLAQLGPDGKASWLKTLTTQGVLSSVAVGSVAVSPDGSGLIAIGGAFTGTLDLGGSTIPLTASPNQSQLFVAGFDQQTGAALWADGFSTPGQTAPAGLQVAFTAQGSLYVAGGFAGTITVGTDMWTSQSSVGGNNILLAQLTSDGSVNWSKTFGNADSEWAAGLAVDPVTGNLVMMGPFGGTLDFGDAGANTVTGASTADAFIAVLGSDGTCIAAGGYGADQDLRGFRVAFGKGSRVVAAGSFANKGLDFGAGASLTAQGGDTAFVAAFDGKSPPSPLSALWQSAFQSSKQDSADGLAADPTNGGSVVVGSYAAPLFYGSVKLPWVAAPGKFDGFVVRLDDSGNVEWARSLQGPAADVRANSVAIVPGAGDVVVGGTSTGPFDVTPDGGLDASFPDASEGGYIMKLAP